MKTDNTKNDADVDDDQEELRCPQCRSEMVERWHHAGSFGVPECRYWRCEACLHQWGHE